MRLTPSKHTIMGVTGEETAEVSAAWPNDAANGLTFLTVNTALNNLLGYSHRQWRQLRLDIDGEEESVAQALMAWRDEEKREGGGKSYFDALM